VTDPATRPSRPVEDLVGRVADEFIAALDRGERPDVEGFARRHPPYAAVLRDVLTALLAMRSAPGSGDPKEAASGATAAPVAEAVDPTGRLGDYRILREVGRGGMGVVYEAEQVSLGRRVALKVLPFAAALEPKQLQRFRNEALAAAHLHHPHIVPVFAVGCERGTHFYAMQFIDGRDLAAVVRGLRGSPARPAMDGPTPPGAALTTARSAADPAFVRAVAGLGAQAAEALEHAHQLGVVHRDVKPANLIVDGAGHLWVTDFGLARLQNDAGLTRTGDLLGTLAYMSPEQARGRPALVDHRTDIYSLGASLYELLALAPPFRADGRAELLRAVAEEEPVPPGRLNRAVPAELETVLLKALAKAPADRYPTAQEFADDLRRFLDDKPVRARRPTAGQRLRRWARRHRPAVWAAAVAGAAVVVAAVAALVSSNVAIKGERDRAQAAERERTLQLFDALVAQARASRLAARVGARAEALAALEDAARLAAALGVGPDRLLRLRNEVIAAGMLTDLRIEREWDGFPVGSRAVTFDADLRRYARCEADGAITVRRTADDGEEVRLDRAASDSGETHLQFLPDGNHLAVNVVTEVGPWAALWDLDRRRVVFQIPDARRIDVSLAGNRVAAISQNGAVRVFDVGTGRQVARFVSAGSLDPNWNPRAIQIDPAGRMVVAYQKGVREVPVWHLSVIDRPRTLSTPDEAGAVAWHPDGRELAVGSGTTALVWELSALKPRLTLTGHLAYLTGLVYSADGRLLASTSHDGTMRLWDPGAGRPLLTVAGARGPWFGRDGRLAFARGTRLVLARLDLPQAVRTLLRTVEPDTTTYQGFHGKAATWAMDFGPDGRVLVGAGSELNAWDPAAGSGATVLPAAVRADVVFEPGGHLVTGSPLQAPPLMRWPLTPISGAEPAFRLGPPRAVPYPNGGMPWGLSLSRDGRTLATGSGEAVYLLDWPVGTVRKTLVPAKASSHLGVSPDGRWVAAGSDRDVQVWDGRTGALVHRLAFPVPTPCRVEFSPDPADGLLVVGTETEYRGLEPGSWRQAWAIPREATDGFPGVTAFSPDGRLLAAAHPPSLVKLYQADTAAEVATLPAPDPLLVRTLRFDPDGRRLAAGGEGNRVYVWDLRVIRRDLARLSLDWGLTPPPADGGRPVLRVDGDLGEQHPARLRLAHVRQTLQAEPVSQWANNALARLLVAGPGDLRDPASALPPAEAAVRLSRRPDGNVNLEYLTTLGIVYYRLGRLKDAADTLARVDRESHPDQTILIANAVWFAKPAAETAFYVAMCRQRLGKELAARSEFNRAVRWMDLFRPDDQELLLLRAEAEALVGP
jgi:serine/threonine protein kinase/WD40 repeat protein